MSTANALQDALAAEHAAIFVYGIHCARVSRSADPQLSETLLSAYRAHRTLRDRLRSLLLSLQVEPVAAAVSYEVPDPPSTSRAIAAAAQDTERRCQAIYAAGVARTVGDARQVLTEALIGSATLVISLGGSPEAWPGAAELAEPTE